MNVKETKKFSRDIRVLILKMLTNLGFGHYGGSLSVVETLAVLYNDIMKYDINDINSVDRDYFVLSKGHAGPALYSTLALKGFFPVEELFTINQNGTNLPSHPDRLKTRGVDATTGSLGQGISIAAGIATSLKLDKKENRVFSIIGDGELNEGQCWEAFQYIIHNNLKNLVTFIDYNKKQLDGTVFEICNPLEYEDKFKAFGFCTTTVKGDDIEAIYNAITKECDKPKMIILDSIKGQGIKYIEEMEANHHIRVDEKFKSEIEKEIKRLDEMEF